MSTVDCRSLTIGVAGPVSLQSLAPHLDVPHSLTDGMKSQIVTSIILELRRRGHRVEVFTLSPAIADVGVYEGDQLRVHVGPCRAGAGIRARDVFRTERAFLLDAMTKVDCDLIHAHWTYEFALAAMSSHAPSLVTIHDWAPSVLAHQRHPYRVVRLAMQIRVIRNAEALTSNSPYIADNVRRYYGRTTPVIPNGVSLQPMSSAASTSATSLARRSFWTT